MSKARGLTITEVMIVLAIATIVAAILLPVFASARRASQIRSSVERMRQAYFAVQLYRNDYDGHESTWNSPYELGLPPDSYWTRTWFGLGVDFWRSPCGADRKIFETGPCRWPGSIVYSVGEYDQPNEIHYLLEYRQNSVLIVDAFCNKPGTVMGNPFTTKRALAVLFSGQLINRMKRGGLASLESFSDPPQD